MVVLQLTNLVPPSKQTSSVLSKQGNAIDMNISWTGTLKIANARGETIEIECAPSSGMNSELHKVAKTYGVIKFLGGFKDVPHWSTDGR